MFATCTYSLKIHRTSNMWTTYTSLRKLDLKWQKIEKIAKQRKLKKIANCIKVSLLRPKQRESRSWSHSLSQSCSWRWPRTTIPSSRVGKEESKQEWRCEFFLGTLSHQIIFFYGSDFLCYLSRSDLLLDILKFTVQNVHTLKYVKLLIWELGILGYVRYI